MAEPVKMNANVKRRWLKALRSGEYKQGKHYLHLNDSYCCLGVLCDLYSKSKPDTKFVKHPASNPLNTVYKFGEEVGVLPENVQKWAGLTSNGAFVKIDPSDGPTYLTDWNDKGAKFDEIADWVETNL